MDYSKIYNAEYYKTSCGEIPYENTEIWKPSMIEKAEHIIRDINPRTVLDVGCAMGYLVEALRDRGIDAYGIDVSEYAISKVREDIRPYCKNITALEDLPSNFPKKYDLVITIEVVEHLYEEDCEKFLSNIINYSDDILFSSSPDDITEITHYNVQQPEYWSKKFASYQFIRNLEYDASYISPHAVRFMKCNLQKNKIVENYEKYIRICKFNYETKYKNDINEKLLFIDNLNNTLKLKENQIDNLSLADSNKNSLIQVLNEKINNLDTNLQNKDNKLKELENKIEKLKGELAETENLIGSKEDEISEYKKVVSYIDDQRKIAEASYSNIINSTFWKITSPIRVLFRILKWIFVNNSLVQNIKIVLYSIKNNGFKSTLRKIKSKISKKNLSVNTSTTIDNLNYDGTVKALINQRFRNTQPIANIHIDNNITRLNLVTDSIEKNSLLGGVATALIIATEFARFCNIPLRIITRNTPVNPLNYKNIIRLSGLENYENVEFYSDYDRDNEGNLAFKLEVSKNDIFFATSWWSAKAIEKTSIKNKFFYIIQEVETFFYPHGEEHYLCTEVMNNPDIDFIINSKYLYDYFNVNIHHICDNGIYFNPAFPSEMYKPSKFIKKNKYKLFFYARPNNPRNLFYQGIRLLDFCIKTGVLDTEQWEIICAGQNIPEIKFCNGYIAKDLGLMDWDVYANFLSQVDLAVSLMYTPHPSYPPFDVACSGGIVLTNSCFNKINIEECKNIIVTGLSEDVFALGMQQAIDLAQDMSQREKNYNDSMIQRSWENNLNNIMDFMKEKLEYV